MYIEETVPEETYVATEQTLYREGIICFARQTLLRSKICIVIL